MPVAVPLLGAAAGAAGAGAGAIAGGIGAGAGALGSLGGAAGGLAGASGLLGGAGTLASGLGMSGLGGTLTSAGGLLGGLGSLGAGGGIGSLGGVLSSAGNLASSLGGLGGGAAGGGASMPLSATAGVDLSGLSQDELESIFGSKPEFNEITFTPFFQQDPGGESLSRDIIQGNLNNFGLSSKLSGKINDFQINEAKDRLTAFDPLGLQNLRQAGRNVSAALGGQLSFGDANRTVANRGRLASRLGTAGTQRAQTAYDLGQTRQGLTEQGAGLLGALISSINSIIPPQLLSSPETYMLTPSQALPIAADDNQFGATFAQSERDKEFEIDSMPDPVARGLFDRGLLPTGFGRSGSGGSRSTANAAGAANRVRRSLARAF